MANSWWGEFSDGQITRALRAALALADGESPVGGGGIIHREIVGLDDAGIKTLPSQATGLELVQMPGPGMEVWLLSIFASLTSVVGYSDVNAPTWEIYDSAFTDLLATPTDILTGVLASTGVQSVVIPCPNMRTGTAPNDPVKYSFTLGGWVNKGIVLFDSNGNDYTGGDGGNSLRFTTIFMVRNSLTGELVLA